MRTLNVKSKRDRRVLEFMLEEGGITTLQAFKELGNTRLSGSIHELRSKGYAIADEWATFENRYGEKCRVKRYYIEG